MMLSWERVQQIASLCPYVSSLTLRSTIVQKDAGNVGANLHNLFPNLAVLEVSGYTTLGTQCLFDALRTDWAGGLTKVCLAGIDLASLAPLFEPASGSELETRPMLFLPSVRELDLSSAAVPISLLRHLDVAVPAVEILNLSKAIPDFSVPIFSLPPTCHTLHLSRFGTGRKGKWTGAGIEPPAFASIVAHVPHLRVLK